MNCPRCNSEKTIKNGKEYSTGKQVHLCKDCKRSFTDNVTPAETNRKPKIGMSLTQKPLTATQLLKIHDMKTKVMDVLKDIPDTEDGVFFEKAQIAKMAGCSAGNDDFREAINSNELSIYSATTLDGRKVYFSNPDTIKKYKKGESQIFRP